MKNTKHFIRDIFPYSSERSTFLCWYEKFFGKRPKKEEVIVKAGNYLHQYSFYEKRQKVSYVTYKELEIILQKLESSNDCRTQISPSYTKAKAYFENLKANKND